MHGMGNVKITYMFTPTDVISFVFSFLNISYYFKNLNAVKFFTFTNFAPCFYVMV